MAGGEIMIEETRRVRDFNPGSIVILRLCAISTERLSDGMDSGYATSMARKDQDVVAGFPRGLPDGDQHKPVATAQWPSIAETRQTVPEWKPGMLLLGRDGGGRYYGHVDDRHVLTVAGSRAGKGVSLLVPNLLHWPGSAICIDPKGELATITASRRSAEGSDSAKPMTPGEGKVFALDPFDRVTGPAKAHQASFNPLGDIDPETERGLNLAWQIADSLVIQSQGEGAHWTQAARSFLGGLILYVAATEVPTSKNLIRIRALLTQGRKEFTLMLAAMKEMGGIIGRTADALDSKPSVEKWSVISTCEVHTAFLEGESMRSVLCGTDFRLEDLKSERVTIYLCLPATRLATHGRWLRMIISLAIEAMERTGPLKPGQHRVLFCLDEFAALGHMESIEAAAGQIASFGVKLWPILQDLTQLQRDYKLAWETFMGNAGLLTFFGNTDLTTAEHIAKRLGDTEMIRTVESKSWQTTSGGSRPDFFAALTGKGSSSINDSTNEGHNTNQQILRGALMNPDEIARFFAREAGNLLAIIPSLRPFALNRCTYYSDQDAALFKGLYDPPPEFTAAHDR